jgi:hypothetical protein
MDWITNPIDSSVISDGVVSWVNADNFKELIGSVFPDPIRVQNS